MPCVFLAFTRLVITDGYGRTDILQLRVKTRTKNKSFRTIPADINASSILCNSNLEHQHDGIPDKGNDAAKIGPHYIFQTDYLTE